MFVLPFLSLFTAVACESGTEHTAPAITDRDSVALMITYGVNTLISDSGVMKYRIVAEEWEINQNRNPSRWTFRNGLFLEEFDKNFHVEAYLQADTAYYYDVKRLWELRGRVRVRTKDGMRFMSEELFWDQNNHELYSNRHSRLITPTRELEGSYFLSDERLTHYIITNSKGSFVKGQDGFVTSESDTILSAPDTVKSKLRTPVNPKAKSPVAPLASQQK
ncbi:MAG: LPS export ABC transporter periplasmic protein LptC [Prevotella sp.]|uniref:LPS export ABC transporter periplasmic protein LptC n=1 Tax=Prevotella sp. TaxID=59823 RepID=UPI002A2EEA5C|nr:LPS export ABC transporter periplasmic protein LptC [Prevotella sp.]MDD7318856.1 LPS export ABC transporter periplasmic protein LptC [Prevotellaceae bacterium]MDY4019233.1 LPS export ABC transporter periplasmic protein LptC [Prevotella sp.]